MSELGKVLRKLSEGAKPEFDRLMEKMARQVIQLPGEERMMLFSFTNGLGPHLPNTKSPDDVGPQLVGQALQFIILAATNGVLEAVREQAANAEKN